MAVFATPICAATDEAAVNVLANTLNGATVVVDLELTMRPLPTVISPEPLSNVDNVVCTIPPNGLSINEALEATPDVPCT